MNFFKQNLKNTDIRATDTVRAPALTESEKKATLKEQRAILQKNSSSIASINASNSSGSLNSDSSNNRSNASTPSFR